MNLVKEYCEIYYVWEVFSLGVCFPINYYLNHLFSILDVMILYGEHYRFCTEFAFDTPQSTFMESIKRRPNYDDSVQTWICNKKLFHKKLIVLFVVFKC